VRSEPGVGEELVADVAVCPATLVGAPAVGTVPELPDPLPVGPLTGVGPLTEVGPVEFIGLGGTLLPKPGVGPVGPEIGVPPVEEDAGVGTDVGVEPLVGTGVGACVFDDAGPTPPGWLGEATAIVVPSPATTANAPVPRATCPIFRRRIRREPAARMLRASSRAVERCA
jgi:hypothetical protein